MPVGYDRMKVTLTYRGWPNVRKLNLIVKEGLAEIADHWFFTWFKKRFSGRAVSEYGYKPRKPYYDRLKEIVAGKTIRRWFRKPIRPITVARNQPRPIVLSGETKRQATRGASFSGTSKRHTVSINVPWYVTKGAHKDRLATELTTLSQREIDILAHKLDHFVEREMNADQEVVTKRIA